MNVWNAGRASAALLVNVLQSRGLQDSEDVPHYQMPPRVGCSLKQAPVTSVPEPRPVLRHQYQHYEQ